MKRSVLKGFALLSFGVMIVAGFAPVALAQQSEPSTHCRFVPERKDDFAWENDLIAFRAYGPALRPGAEDSGIDCWLKRVKYPVIDKWYRQALKEKKSYHEDHGEGYDPYHVGSSAGCGGSALWLNGHRVSLETFTDYKVLESGPERSRFVLNYEREIDGVVYSEQRTFTIELGQRLFTVQSLFKKDGQPATDLPVCIGITTHDGKATTNSNKSKGWIACWETIDNSGIGTAAMVDPKRIEEIKEVNSNGKKDTGHIFLITNTDDAGTIDYRAGYGWEKAGDIKTLDDWKQYLNGVAE